MRLTLSRACTRAHPPPTLPPPPRPQLDRKLEHLRAMFASLPPPGDTLPELEVFESAPINCACVCTCV